MLGHSHEPRRVEGKGFPTPTGSSCRPWDTNSGACAGQHKQVQQQGLRPPGELTSPLKGNDPYSIRQSFPGGAAGSMFQIFQF